MLSKEEIVIQDPKLKEVVGRARFYSITYRLFKLPGMLETKATIRLIEQRVSEFYRPIACPPHAHPAPPSEMVS